MRVLVCGGRDYTDKRQLNFELDLLNLDLEIEEIIHGDARGADRLAKAWAEANGIKATAYPADWQRYGNAAGPIRNSVMLAETEPDLVVAFHGGAGTADMMAKARAAGVPVLVIDGPESTKPVTNPKLAKGPKRA